MTPFIWIIGGSLAGFITAYRLLTYGFRIGILERRPESDKQDHPDLLPPVWPGFFHATWSLLQELSLPLPPFHTGGIEVLSPAKERFRIPRLPVFSGLHVFPELFVFQGLSWRDRLNLLNSVEQDWEGNNANAATPDTQTAETWVMAAGQSPRAQQEFWNPLCRWLLGCNLSEASSRMFQTILVQYAHAKSTGTQWFFAHPSTLIHLKTGLRELLIQQGVQFHCCEEYPPFQSTGKNGEHLSPAGDRFPGNGIYVAALTPEDILPLLPERSLTKFAQLDHVAQIPRDPRLLLTFTLAHLKVGPTLILCPNHIDWIVISPPAGSLGEDIQVACLLRDAQDHEGSEPHPDIRKTWSYLQACLPFPHSHSPTSCPPGVRSQALNLYPSLTGTRAFRPANTSPVRNFFLVGPWTGTSHPPSMESLVSSANACAEAIAHQVFSGFR